VPVGCAQSSFPDAWLLLLLPFFVMSLCWVDAGTSLNLSLLFLPPGVFLFSPPGHCLQPSFLSPNVPFAFALAGPLNITLPLCFI
jgi:hypothetical protein